MNGECEPWALTRTTTHKGGGLWLTILASISSWNLFNANELEEGGNPSSNLWLVQSLDRPMTNTLVTDTTCHGTVCDDCHLYHQVLSSVYVNLAPLRI